MNALIRTFLCWFRFFRNEKDDIHIWEEWNILDKNRHVSNRGFGGYQSQDTRRSVSTWMGDRSADRFVAISKQEAIF